MQAKGHLDGIDGGSLVGWAVPADGQGTCNIEVLDSAGIVLARGRASRERPDLAVLGLGRINIAFRVPIAKVDYLRELHVLADGIELPNSPILSGPGHFDGFIEIQRSTVIGWVEERADPSNLNTIEVIDQYGKLVAQQSKIEFSGTGFDGQPCAYHFEIELSQNAFGRGELQLTAIANSTAFARTTCDLELLGALDKLSNSRCAGWLFSPNDPKRVFTLEVLVDDRVVATTNCNNPREDVRNLYPICRDPGFEVQIPSDAFKSVQPHYGFSQISFRIIGSSLSLFDGPYIYADRATAIAAAKSAAATAKALPERFPTAHVAILERAVHQFVDSQRQCTDFIASRSLLQNRVDDDPIKFNVIIPIYRGVEITKACIESVVKTVSPADVRIVLINDASPDASMCEMLSAFQDCENVFLLTNPKNVGFVKTVNRGLRFCRTGDVILLNSDTRVFEGGLSELWRAAHSSANIGTATAISNNATIFSYPHLTLRCDALEDVTWAELAGVALRDNKDILVDLPTGHGFCMLIRRELLEKLGDFDEAFGRGYGEENDFCIRGSDLGFRNVAVPCVFVEHREGISFRDETKTLLTQNLARIDQRYPEYTPNVMMAEAIDELRVARWTLDRYRLNATIARHVHFALIISHALGGGTDTAISDIESVIGYGESAKMRLLCRHDGYMELRVESPSIRAVFAPTDIEQLFKMLSAVRIKVVAVHSLLGFSESFMKALVSWIKPHRSVYYAHDFYALCPRVTMIDALGEFCNVAVAEVCNRCTSMDGSHESSMLSHLKAEDHRDLFLDVLRAFQFRVAPSENTAGYYRNAFANLEIKSIAHPEVHRQMPVRAREGTHNEIVLLGALGRHKGSRKLFEIASRARLSHPHLRFRVIGYTDIDDQLTSLGNVTVTGKYQAPDLAPLLHSTKGRLALFLSLWPETYSYTLSECVRFGFIPIVPDIGALADRVRHTGFGVVFPFPFSSATVLAVLDGIASGIVELWRPGITPAAYSPDLEAIAAGHEILNGSVDAEEALRLPELANH